MLGASQGDIETAFAFVWDCEEPGSAVFVGADERDDDSAPFAPLKRIDGIDLHGRGSFLRVG